jgi:VIT1/CCC1 family predicted Fe2+/Mn2+ transporter
LRISRTPLRMVILGLGVAFVVYGVVQIFLLPTLW